MPFTVQHPTGWYVTVLDSAMRHLTAIEVRTALNAPEVIQAIDAASSSGDILHWNGGVGYGRIVLSTGVTVLIRYGHDSPLPTTGGMAVGYALLTVFHTDRGDNYRAENLQSTRDRFSGSGSYLEMMAARQKK